MNIPEGILEVLRKQWAGDKEGWGFHFEMVNYCRRERERVESALASARLKAIDACLDMANRYDQDIEGCDGDDLLRYSEAITCCFRLAHIVKYGEFPPKATRAVRTITKSSPNVSA